MCRLNEYGKAWRDYLYVLDGFNEAVERDIETFETRIRIIDESRNEWMAHLLSEEPDTEIIEECKKEIKYQREQLYPMIKEYCDYCKNIGLDELEPTDLIENLCKHGADEELFIILSEWKPIAKAASNIWSIVDDKYGRGMDYAEEDFKKAFMDEMYANKEIRNILLEKHR